MHPYVLGGYCRELAKLAADEGSGKDIAAISGAAVGGGLAQHALPAVGKAGMTAFRRGAGVAALIGTGNLVGRRVYAATAKKREAKSSK